MPLTPESVQIRHVRFAGHGRQSVITESQDALSVNV